MPLFKKLRNVDFLWKSYHMKPKLDTRANCFVDLRSDTVTKPCLGMRQAMKEADVGDDVFQEDPTVIELEHKMAEITQKDAGLFVLSGTMGNLLSILSHCGRRGSEILIGNKSHIFTFEQANIAQFGGVQPHPVTTNSDGTFSLDVLKSCIREDDFHLPTTELICLENTHGNLGGKALPLKWLNEVSDFAKCQGLPIHVDGARIFNASIASQVPVSHLLKIADSTSICLSKGLGCPVGSVIVGNDKFIKRARRLRKALGGAWRQGGIMAAAGLYSLENNVVKLRKDHENAKLIAKGISDMKNQHFKVCYEDVHTNIIMLHVNKGKTTGEELCNRLSKVNEEENRALNEKISVLALPFSNSSVRLVTHLDIGENEAKLALAKIQYVIEEYSRS